MDRWGEDGALERHPKQPMGNVARMGMGGFVKADQGSKLCISM